MEINGIPSNAIIKVWTKYPIGVDIYNNPIFEQYNTDIKVLIAYNNTNTTKEADRNIVEDMLTIYLNGEPDIKSWDKIELNNNNYVIDGSLEVWVNPFSQNKYSVLKIRKYNG